MPRRSRSLFRRCGRVYPRPSSGASPCSSAVLFAAPAIKNTSRNGSYIRLHKFESRALEGIRHHAETPQDCVYSLTRLGRSRSCGKPFRTAVFAVRAGSGGRRLVEHHRATPDLTGSDGSQTGIASFQGNFTTIVAPNGQDLALYRWSNCSLTLGIGINEGGGSYTQTSSTANYERVLHSEAGLTTTADVFPSKCALQPTPGFGSRPVIFVGTTTTGINVFASIALTSAMSNGLYITKGTTTFTVTSNAFAAAGVVTSGDLNGDGNGDLVITNTTLSTSGGAVTVMLGNADGSFQTAVTYPTAGNGAVAAVIDDVNGDGKLDIVAVSDTQQISVLLGKGDGNFAAAQSFAAPILPGQTSAAATPIINLITADLRHIGKKDIICSNGAVLLGKGDGTFTPASAPAFPYVIGTSNQGPNLGSGDFNNDGKPDIMLSTGSNVLTYLGKGDGTFTAGNSYAAINTVGFAVVDDLDGDGNADIYLGLGNAGAYGGGDYSDGNLAYALMGRGDGTFSGAPTILGTYTGTNLGDVNGDGLPDIITNAPAKPTPLAPPSPSSSAPPQAPSIPSPPLPLPPASPSTERRSPAPTPRA